MTAMEEDVDDRFAGIDIDSLLNRAEKRSFNYGRKKTLYEAPEFIQRLNGEETVMEGQSLCIECKVAGFPAPTLRWYKDDEEIVDHGRIHIESNGRGGYCLIIDNVNKGDEAAYRCRAENVEGASSSRFFLSVKSKPKSPKKKDSKSSPNRRTVSFPPMFATIVEKVEEEEKQGIELAKLPPSPMTEFYYALTLKSRQSWPTFLGEWAFANSPEKRRTDRDERQVQSEPATLVSTGRKQRFVGQNGNAEISDSKKQRMTEETKLKIEKENEKLKKLEEEKMKREAERKMDEERKRREEAMSLRKKAREERRRRENSEAEKSKTVDVVENNFEMKDEEKDKEKSMKQEQEKSIVEQKIQNKHTHQEETKTHPTLHQESVNKDADHKKQENASKTDVHSNSDQSPNHLGNKTADLRNKITDQSKTLEPAPDKVVPKKSVLQKFAKHLEPSETKPETTEKRGPQTLKGVHDKFNKTSETSNKTRDSVNKTTLKVDTANKQATTNDTANKTSLKSDPANKTDTKTVNKTEPTGTKTAPTQDKTNKTSAIQDKINQIAPGNCKTPQALDKFSKTTPTESKSTKPTQDTSTKSTVQSTTAADKGNLKDSNKANTSVSQNAAQIPPENKQNKDASKPMENNKFTSSLQTKEQQKNAQEQKQIEALKQKEKSQLDALKEREKSQLDSLRQKEKTQIDALRQREKNQIDALRQREKEQIEALRQREKNQRDALRQSEKDKIEEKDKKQNDTVTNKVQKTFTQYGSKSTVPEKNDEKIRKEQKEKEEKQKEELRLKEEKQKEELREKEKKQREELRNKEQKGKDTLKEKEEKQKEELRLKEIKMREDLRRHQEDEERRRENKKEQLRQEQLMRQYEEENKRRMERLREEAKLKEANKDDVNNDEEVKVYKRDYSFSELRQSLEAHLGGDVMSAEEHKYWDDILEKHAYSISDIKKAFDKIAEERPARSKTRRNSVEETDLALIKRSSSISDLKDSYTNSLGRPKKKTSETVKRQKDEEFLKRAASISDLRQQFLEEVKKQSSPAKLLSVPGKQEAEITIRNLKISDSLKPSEVRQRSKSPTPTPLYTPPQQGSEAKPLTRNQSELTKLAGTVASKRASFHEMLSQRTQPDTSSAQKRLSYQSRDAYGSRDIPVYRRAAGWSDDVDKLQKPTTSTEADQNQPSPLKQNKPEKSEASSGNQDGDKPETSAGNIRPFVYNSTRTTARNSTGSIQENYDSSSDEDVFTDSDSSSGPSETSLAQNPLFYLGNNNDGPSTHQDLVIFNTNALQSEDEIIESCDNTNNNVNSTYYPDSRNNYLKLDNAQENDLKIVNSDNKKKKGNNDKCKEKSENVSLNQELSNMKILNTAQDKGVSKGFETNLGYAGDQEMEKLGNVLKNTSASNLEGCNFIFSNSRAGAIGEPAPPIVVEMWDEVEEPRSPNLRSSDSIRIPNGNSLDAYMREEREPTPFSFGSNLTSESLLHGVKSDEIFNLDSPRVTRESTAFLDKGNTALLGGSPEIENKEFHREPTPFYDNKTSATLCFGTELQIPGNISVDREPRESTPFFKADAEKSPRTTLDPMKTSSSSTLGAEAKSANNAKRGVPVPPSKPNKVKSKASGDKKDAVNITINTDKPQRETMSSEENSSKNLNSCKILTKDVRGAMAVTGERRSRSETRANRSQTTVEVATVEAPKPRQLSVPRDTSPTVANTISQAQTSRQQKDLTKSGQDKKQSGAKLNKSPQISKQQPSTSKLTANVTRSADTAQKLKLTSSTGRESKTTLNQNANQDLDVDKTNQKVKTKAATAMTKKQQTLPIESKPKSKQSSSTNGKKAESDSITTKESKRKTQQTVSDTQKPLTLTSRLKKSIKVLMPQTENKSDNESSRTLGQSTDQENTQPDINSASMPIVLANPFASFDTMRTSHFGVSLITNPPPADTTMPHNKPIAMVKARPKHVTSVLATPSSDSSSSFDAQSGNGLDASNRRSRDVKPKTLSGTLTSFFKPKPTDKENRKKTSKQTERKKKSKSTKPEDPQERGAVVGTETSVKTLSELALAKCSPFGRHSMEGLLFIFIMTMICLNLEMPVEKFLCYIIASFYTFCVLRILGLVE